MQINEEYKNIECIKRLKDQYKNNFFEIVKYYAPKLPEKLVTGGSAYTLHNFNQHCINIYQIISNVILYPKTAYAEEGLTDKELYILDLAVLFHDIGMEAYLDSSRKDHSRKSAEYIQEIYHAKDSVFKTHSMLDENEVKALRLIIMAHSDIKDGSIQENENGLNNPELRNDMVAQLGNIRGIFLASILRLADELDITVGRLGNSDIEIQLSDIREKKLAIEREINPNNSFFNQKELEYTEKLLESLEHWERLHLFSNISRTRESEEVVIRVNDDYIKKRRDIGDTYESLVDNILRVFKKINKEFKNGLAKKTNEDKSPLDLKKMLSVDRFKIVSNIPEINELIAEQLVCLNTVDLKSDKLLQRESLTGEKAKTDIKESAEPEVIDEGYQKNLSKIIKRKHLLSVGHFLLDETYCARDWIDTKEIVETRSIVDEIISNIIKHINTNCREEEYLLLGLDLEGSILASRVAMALQKPFSYLIPAREMENNSGKDAETVIEKYKKYIIVTDAIVTFETIKRVYDSIGNENDNYKSILQIYTVFYRKPFNYDIKGNDELIKKTICVSKDFPIELFKKEECPYKDEGCFGKNRKIR